MSRSPSDPDAGSLPPASAPSPTDTSTRATGEDLRAASKLVVEATAAVTEVVEAMHLRIGAGPAILGKPLLGLTRFFTGPIYGAIRGGARIVGAGVDLALEQLGPLLGEATPGLQRDAVLAALNGVLGDHLTQSGNALAIPMALRPTSTPDAPAPSAAPSPWLLVLVHGSSTSERCWLRGGHDHGAALAADLGCTPLYLRYNSGLHVSQNGRAFADQLERAVAAWPVPVERITLLAHSMGGLVSRSALHYGAAAGHRWRPLVRDLVCLGTPHHGAPLERLGSWFELLLGISSYSGPLARLARLRSQGVTDLRHGNVVDEDWQGHQRFARPRDPRLPLPLPADVACYAVAATTAAGPSTPEGRLPGDGLVPVESALGRHKLPSRTLQFPEAHQYIAYSTDHMGLLGKDACYDVVRRWLADPA